MERNPAMTKVATTMLVAAAMMLPLASATARVRQTPFEQVALQRFHRAVDDYVSLHRHLERPLPPLQVTSDSQQICQAVDALAAAIRSARPGARIGDLLDSEIGEVLRTRIEKTLRDHGDTVADVLAAINEEAPVDGKRPIVNGRFDWALGAMVPPAILSVLPALPDELQYRLVDRDLVLIDLDGALVVDILPAALRTPS
jgi:hypothetical protein